METVNTNSIQRIDVQYEFLVQSTRQDTNLVYIINSEIRVYSCVTDMSSTPYKHQGAVTMKYHIAIFNFLLSLTPDDRMLYAYVTFGKKSDDVNKEIDILLFDSFLKKMKADYQNSSLQLCTALDKFAEQYQIAKSKSISRLISFLYDLNQNANPISCVKSGSMIRIQVESVRHRKIESRDAK
ncbi:16974_t:CDS:2 [Funneliformis caledonium]|uniref:16974_t:CDS:1 n=1 Tax=Funneliformis caledonium TaxID=1117310 RepID=A0A9N8V7K5_9GLOM|nr:16974_t:CDS:2 [Funneliformis caledonium]